MAHRQRASDLERAVPAERTCVSCGRRITWRASWAKDWAHVKYCSGSCRRHGVDATDHALERSIEQLLSAGAADASISPSDAARAVGGDAWRELL